MSTALYILIVISRIYADVEVISNENKDDMEHLDATRRDRHTYRRFKEELSDHEFHVAHIRDSFTNQSECPAETLEDRIRNHKKIIKNDPGFIEFVSAHALDGNETDIKAAANSTCKYQSEDTKQWEKKYLNIRPENNRTDFNATHGNDTRRLGSNTATKAPVKKKLSKMNLETGRRDEGDQYQFSSPEYYDEPAFFDNTACPDVIDVIKLEIDQLRPYDVECGLLLVWTSLE